ncbi:MAG: hypothetical protein ACPGSB_11770, partial [Opitutales bacterium]
MNNKTLPLISLGILLFGFSINAQGGFVLFGDSDVKISPEHKTVRPLTGPYFHEDAFVTTDLRAWYLVHHFDNDTVGVLNNGDVTVAALQVRVAISESLQFVAYKDGYTSFDDAGATVGDNDGMNDIGVGLKWAFIQD